MTLNADAETATLSVTYATQQGCSCPICAGTSQDTEAALVADASGTVQVDDQGFLLDVSNPASGLVGTTMPNGLPVLSSFESAIQIARSSSWASFDADLELTYSVSADGVADGFAFDADYQAATRRIFAFYAEISGLRFREIEAGSAETPNMKLYNIDQQGGGGWAALPGSGTSESGIGYPWTPGDVNEGSYVYLTLIHEIGHLLGLNHPGNYNGSVDYLTQAVFWNDSKQYSVMSYLGEGMTGADFAGSAATPMLFDILAIQLEYGINWTTRAGDTTYGFNSNSGVAAYAFTAADNTSAFTIWDGAGTDTLDFSGFVTDTVMDLRQGGFSSTGVETYNVAIAYNAVIENAIGGAGVDRIRGNEVGNRLHGGRGEDALYGGAETDAPAAPDPRAFTGIELNHAVLERGQYLSVSDVQSLSSPQLSVEMMLTLDRVPDGSAALMSYAVPNNSNEFLLEAGSQGTLRLIIDGQARYDTPILTRSLADGQPHRISMTWDSQTGAVAFYIDGALAHEGIYTAAIGRVISTGGTLVIGQDQDTVGGGFQPREYLPGTVGDIRIFDDIRSATEIADHAFAPLTGTEPGLINNWQVSPGDTTHVTDTATANPSVNLTDLLPGYFTASQSSQYSSGFAAGNVLDNALSTQNHTNAGPNEWLQVTFSQPLEVTHIQVQNVTGWGSRLNGATVSVLDAQGHVVYTWAPISGEGYYGSNLTFRLPEAMQISALRIDQHNQNLHVSEINVFGRAPEGVAVPEALLNTDLTIHGGAVAVEVGAALQGQSDDDTLRGGLGDDSLYGGAGNDSLMGHGDGDNGFLAPLHGINLNEGSTTNQYLGVSNYTGLSGAAGAVQFTVEMAFRITGAQPSEIDFLSYANGQTSNALILGGDRDGNLYLDYRGTEQAIDVPTALLMDGAAHRLSLTWDGRAATAGFVLYLDGQEIARGIHANQGLSLSAGGTLIFGQEQDTLGGGFQSSQIFRGVLGDIRIFDHAISAEEVAAGAAAALTGLVPGLVSNWQAGPDSTGSLTDSRGGAALAITGAAPVARLGGWDDDLLSGGTGHDRLSGEAGQDSLLGDAGNDTLDGGAGADTLQGGSGDDVYVLSDLLDTIIELAGEGLDRLYAALDFTLSDLAHIERLYVDSAGGHSLTGNALNNLITGNVAADILSGGAGNDTLDGAAGVDTLQGGAGDDLYLADAGDVIQEADAQGYDLVRSAAGQTLSANVEALTLTGSANINGTGNALANTLTGNAGRNVLNGGLGSDRMLGGAGNDTYIVDSTGDRVYETTTMSNAVDAGGIDTVQSLVSLNLNANAGLRFVERLTLTGSANINGTGNALANTLTGNSGNNILNGGLGSDKMLGGAGNDTYVVDSTGDRVFETTTSTGSIDAGGTDAVLSQVSLDLNAYAGVRFVERLTLTGSGNITGTGNAMANTLSGNSGNNILNGGLGSDRLQGGAGHDTFVFNTALGATNIDRISDFNVADDTIRLDDLVFQGLSTGTLRASAFAANLTGTATDASDRIIYETDTGRVYFDADGDGIGARVLFASLSANLALTNADFVVV